MITSQNYLLCMGAIGVPAREPSQSRRFAVDQGRITIRCPGKILISAKYFGPLNPSARCAQHGAGIAACDT
jgi:hypothetical protein